MFILQSERIQTKYAVYFACFKPNKDVILNEKTRLVKRRKNKLNDVFCTVRVPRYSADCALIEKRFQFEF